jgi:hypothetical protein
MIYYDEIIGFFVLITLLRISSTSLGCVLTTWPICVAADRFTARESPLLNNDKRRSSLIKQMKYYLWFFNDEKKKRNIQCEKYEWNIIITPWCHSSFGMINNENLEGNLQNRRKPATDDSLFLNEIFKKHWFYLLVFFLGIL